MVWMGWAWMGIEGHGRENERLECKRSDSFVIYKLRYPVLALNWFQSKGLVMKVTGNRQGRY
jgi:hypothetical protein